MDPQPVGLVGAALGVPALFSMTWPGGLVYSRGSERCSAGRDIDCCSLGRLTRLNQLEAVPFSSIVDAPRARSRPPPPPRRPPLTAAIAAIPALITNATPVAITASDCATIDATLASTTAPSRRPAPGGAHLARSPPPPPSISKAHSRHSLHPRRHHRPCHHLGRNIRRCRALRRVGGPFCPLTPTVKNGHVTAISRGQCGVRTSSLVHWSYNNIVTLRSVADWS